MTTLRWPSRRTTTLHGDPLEACWLVQVGVGLCPGEATALRWRDIDLDAGTLQVAHRRVHDPGGTWRLEAPKTKRSARRIELPQPVGDALKVHKLRQEMQRDEAGSAWEDHDLVFTTTVGTPIDRSMLRRRFTSMTEQAGLGPWHPTELRHLYVSLCSHHGMRLEDIADAAGHATTKMTEGVYRHQVRSTVGSQAKSIMDNLLS